MPMMYKWWIKVIAGERKCLVVEGCRQRWCNWVGFFPCSKIMFWQEKFLQVAVMPFATE